ncbi:von Willebrand factor A domain-containing protein (plasmid) [Rhizobium etli 8C-3]|uniref:von Willebrand factor A domain-containing protein n=2 Tax=Rhizobium etli TaxID=29449 RepID=A0A1L5PAN5_RHIET|nr:von Willebrand factor A domain-containing protein [Rhizobium etli 8C-3]
MLPSDWDERWKAAHRRIDQAGYGETVAAAYRRIGPDLARAAGSEVVLKLGRTVSDVAIRCDRRTAALLPDVALAAELKLSGGAALIEWLATIEAVARSAPKSVAGLLDKSSCLLAVLDIEGFRSFVRMGIAIARRNPERQIAFFSLEDAEAQQYLQRGSGVEVFHTIQLQMKHYLAAIWGIRPPVREVPPDAPEPMRRRCGFGGGGIRVPPAFSGSSAGESNRLYQAALAHIGAHHRFTRRQFPVGSLKPLQVAVISLVEDARVERLAMREMPGLGRLWLPFHVAKPEDPPVALALLGRLSRALIYPDYQDPHGWVTKGKKLFEDAAESDLTDQTLSRRIGGLLGNDLGQMRVQFDSRSYVVQPAYRDDNLGIWDLSEQPPEEQLVLEEMVEGVGVKQQKRDDGKPDEQNSEPDPDQRVSHVALTASDDTETTTARYSEYDYVTGRERPQWCTVREYPAPYGRTEPIRRFEEVRCELSERLSTLFRSSKISRAEKIRRQAEGEFLDIDACIEAAISRRIGDVGKFRVHGRYERRGRDLSVLILLDISQSTADPVRGQAGTVLDVQRLSAALLAKALSVVGDPFAVAAFCSDTRDDIRYFRIKDFERSYDELARSRLAGLESKLSTRLGAAIRHAGEDLRKRKSYRRLLLVITDGEPSDVDMDDDRYLVEDARVAVQHLNRHGIDTFCVALDGAARSCADRVFGKRGTATMSSVDHLPIQLPKIFYKLTR